MYTLDKFTLNRNETVLMIIDIQERLAPAMKFREQVIRKSNTLISTAAYLGIPIIVTEQYPKGLGKTVPDISSNILKALTFEKTTFSSCTEEVVAALKQLGKRKIIVTGMETHVCKRKIIKQNKVCQEM